MITPVSRGAVTVAVKIIVKIWKQCAVRKMILIPTLAAEKIRDSPIKGGPEPLEKKIHEILGSKREDRF